MTLVTVNYGLLYSRGNRSVPKILDQLICSSLAVPHTCILNVRLNVHNLLFIDQSEYPHEQHIAFGLVN